MGKEKDKKNNDVEELNALIDQQTRKLKSLDGEGHSCLL